MHAVLRALAAVILLLVMSVPQADAQLMLPSDVHSPFSTSVSRKADGGVRIDIEIEKGSYLYRDRLAASTGGADVPVSSAPGTPVEDPTFGSVEVWREYAEASIRPEDLPVSGTFSVTWQGCRDGGICLPPTTATFDSATLREAVPETAPTSAPGPVVASSDAAPADGRVAPVLAASGSAAPDPGASGLLAAAGAFLALGLVLAFTPCVYPMYPVLAATLAGGAGAGGRAGFGVSAVFVASMAGVYAAAGSLAALGGSGIQDVLRSPVAAVLSAAILGLLAASAFGFVEMSLPFPGRRAIVRPATGGSRLLKAASGGAVAAFAAGPCVTAPLAGALLYVAEGGDPRVGALLLFALGIGKGIPLVAIGTIGGRFLPRNGPWLSAARTISGAVLAAYAVWTLSAVVPEAGAASYRVLVCASAAVALAVAAYRMPAAGAFVRRGAAFAVLVLGLGSALLVAGSVDAVQTRGGSGLRFAEADVPSDLSRLPGSRPALVYVTAEWCRTCRTIDASVLSDPSVLDGLADFDLLKVDVTRGGPDVERMLASLGAVGAPTLVFLDSANREAPGSRIVGETDAPAVVSSALSAASPPSMFGGR